MCDNTCPVPYSYPVCPTISPPVVNYPIVNRLHPYYNPLFPSFYRHRTYPYRPVGTLPYRFLPYSPLPYNPSLGTYGTSDITVRGMVKNNSCQYGFSPSLVYGQPACCDAYGRCGVGDMPLTGP